MAKQRIHNEWFMPLVKTTCPCGERKTQVFAWGEYANAKWRTVQHFCQACFPDIQRQLVAHAKPCGCAFQLNAKSGYSIPDWIKMPDAKCAA